MIHPVPTARQYDDLQSTKQHLESRRELDLSQVYLHPRRRSIKFVETLVLTKRSLAMSWCFYNFVVEWAMARRQVEQVLKICST